MVEPLIKIPPEMRMSCLMRAPSMVPSRYYPRALMHSGISQLDLRNVTGDSLSTTLMLKSCFLIIMFTLASHYILPYTYTGNLLPCTCIYSLEVRTRAYM